MLCSPPGSSSDLIHPWLIVIQEKAPPEDRDTGKDNRTGEERRLEMMLRTLSMPSFFSSSSSLLPLPRSLCFQYSLFVCLFVFLFDSRITEKKTTGPIFMILGGSAWHWEEPITREDAKPGRTQFWTGSKSRGRAFCFPFC